MSVCPGRPWHEQAKCVLTGKYSILFLLKSCEITIQSVVLKTSFVDYLPKEILPSQMESSQCGPPGQEEYKDPSPGLPTPPQVKNEGQN